MHRNRMIALVLALVFALGLAAGAASYTVVPGDVLWKIAKELGTDYKTLAQYNGIENPNLIYPGQVIKWDEPETPEPKPAPVGTHYTATAAGFGGDVVVTVTYVDGVMTRVQAWGAKETAGVGSKAIEMLPAKILAAKSVAVDGVAGATVTSTAVKAAAAKAIAEAQGKAAASTGMKAGTYTAKSVGMWGDIPVTVTVSGTAITAIAVGSNIETPGLRDWPIRIVPDEIIEQQSVAVDTVTGATFTSMGIIRAVTDCLTQAGADVAAFSKAPEKVKATDITRTADVIIVGGGGAGLAAACSATEQGASVILIEKMGTLGGNSIVSGGIYNAADPAEQEPLGIEDSPAFHAQQTWEGGDKIANKDLVDVLCNNALDGLNWLKGMGMDYKPGVTQGVGSLYRRTHSAVMPNGTGYIKTFLATLDARGSLSEIMMDTTGKTLIVENGRVVGVNALGKDGNKVTLRANKGVIIATGGFAGNVELRVQYCQGEKWPDLGPSLITSNMPGVTGDGIFMARDIGAALVDMEQIQLLQVCNPWTGVTSDVLTGGVDTCVYVNQEGNRFVREDGRRDVISAAILKQTGGRMYTIHNFTLVDNPDTFKALGGRTVNELINEGKYGFVSAETLEGLAEKIGAPYENLKASIDAYNAHVKAGDATDEFGRQLLTTALEGGPWYAYPRAPAAHHTMGGIKIDVGTHVIGTDGAIIPGLYAAGEVTGGIHGGNRLGGNAIVDFTVFGRIAGAAASKGE